MQSIDNLVLETYDRGDLRVIPHLVQLIASNSTDDTRSIGVCFLCQIIQHENDDLIASIVEADGVPSLVSFLRPETIHSHFSSTVSAISVIAKMSQDYCKLVLKSGVLEVMSSRHVSHAWIDFIHGLAMDSEKRSILLEFFHAESVSTLVQSMDLYSGSNRYPNHARIIDILSVVLSKPTTNNIDVGILSEAIPNLIECLRVRIVIGRRATNIVIVMTAIAKASNVCRDRVLQTDVTNMLRGGLDDEDSIFSGHCLILLSLERRHERIMSSVDCIRSGYIRPLVNLMAYDDQSEFGRDIRTAAYHFFALLLKEGMSHTTTDAMVQAEIIPTSINFLKQKGTPDLDICVLHLSALSRIAELSSSHRAKMIYAGIMDLLPSGIKANSVELRSKWIALVNTLITKDSDIIPTMIDSGVIRTLIESMNVKDRLLTEVLSILKDAANKGDHDNGRINHVSSNGSNTFSQNDRCIGRCGSSYGLSQGKFQNTNQSSAFDQGQIQHGNNPNTHNRGGATAFQSNGLDASGFYQEEDENQSNRQQEANVRHKRLASESYYNSYHPTNRNTINEANRNNYDAAYSYQSDDIMSNNDNKCVSDELLALLGAPSAPLQAISVSYEYPCFTAPTNERQTDSSNNSNQTHVQGGQTNNNGSFLASLPDVDDDLDDDEPMASDFNNYKFDDQENFSDGLDDDVANDEMNSSHEASNERIDDNQNGTNPSHMTFLTLPSPGQTSSEDDEEDSFTSIGISSSCISSHATARMLP
eukprot:scaffold36693_cov44-Cyclotella_meneghiniana.AAC.2